MSTVAESPKVTARQLDAEEREALEEQRDFLLQSLRDLEAEHEAGDVDETDYEALRDDYTARAARIIRALEARRVKVASQPEERRPPWRMIAVVAGIVVFALAAGLLVATNAGRRGAGETATGDIRQSTRQTLDQALSLAAQGRYDEAIQLQDEVLDEQPDNVEALTYKGWFQYLSGDMGGVVTLTEAVQADPEYPAAHAFLAVGFRQLGCPEHARQELDRLDQLDPPQELVDLVSGLRESLDDVDPTNCPIPATG